MGRSGSFDARLQPGFPGIDVCHALFREQTDYLRGESGEDVAEQADVIFFHCRKVLPEFLHDVVMAGICHLFEFPEHFTVFREVGDYPFYFLKHGCLLRWGILALVIGLSEFVEDVEAGSNQTFQPLFRVLPSFQLPGERPVFGTGLFRQQQVTVGAFALDAQALADDINGYSGEDEYGADNGGFPEDAVLHPVFGKGGLFLEIFFLRYAGRDLHGGTGEGVCEVDIAVYVVGRFPEVSG